MEYLGGVGQEAQINTIRELIELRLAASGLFAILNVGKVIDYVQNNCVNQVTILHEPTARDPSHSRVHGYKYEDDMVADLIAEVVIRTYPAKSPSS